MKHLDGRARVLSERAELLPIERPLEGLESVRKNTGYRNDAHAEHPCTDRAPMERYAWAVLASAALLAQLSWTPPRPANRAPPPAQGEVVVGPDGEPLVVPVASTPQELADAAEAGAWRRVVRVDATGGLNSNARQIASQDGRNVFPNAALVGTLQLQTSLVRLERNGGSWRIDAGGLVMHNVALDAAVPPNEGSGSMRAQYTHPFSTRSELIVAAGASMGTLAARRATDPRMAAIDPTSLDRTYATTSLELGWLRALGPRTQMGVGLTGTGLFTLADQDESLGPTLTVRHRGLDQGTFTAEFGVDHELTARLKGEGLLRLLHAEQPFALDVSTGTPVNVGPLRTQVATLLGGVGYELDDRFQGDARVGFSAASAPPGDPDKTVVLEPAATVRGAYDDTRRRVAVLASYQYDAAIPRFGSGPTLRAQVYAYGIPVDQSAWRPLQFLFAASADRSLTRTLFSSRLETRTASGTLALRYGLGPQWGIVGGVDLRASRFEGDGLVPPAFTRTLVFLGASWFETNGRDERTLVPFGDMPL